MPYPDSSDLRKRIDSLARFVELKHERGSAEIEPVLDRIRQAIDVAISAVRRLPEDPMLAAEEPDDLETIRSKRPHGPRRLSERLPKDYLHRLEGALVGRFAGCTLGAPVEFWPIDRMRGLAVEHGDTFPPVDYWRAIPFPNELRYETSPRRAYTRAGIDGVPVDDDLAYTILGLLVLEKYGPGFTTADLARAWTEHLPFACTAEEVALNNLLIGVDPLLAGQTDNPYSDWIGASIRADPWGYVAPGWPERAAEFAHRDAFLSHRRQGIYAEMFFAASIAAAFLVDEPMDALHAGLTEIPARSTFAIAVRWALETAPGVTDYRRARQIVEERFDGMHPTHAINNACLVIFGLAIGGRDFTRVIGETVAMGMDNDCNAATAGSIAGVVVGIEHIEPHWHRAFHDRVNTYLFDHSFLSIQSIRDRFAAVARSICSGQ